MKRTRNSSSSRWSCVRSFTTSTRWSTKFTESPKPTSVKRCYEVDAVTYLAALMNGSLACHLSIDQCRGRCHTRHDGFWRIARDDPASKHAARPEAGGAAGAFAGSVRRSPDAREGGAP